MAFLVDDVAEVALGPWGLVIGVGVGAALLARKRLAPVTDSAVASGAGATERARAWLGEHETPAKVLGWAGGLTVTERAQTALAEVGDWWSDLYAEARAEWEAGRTGEPEGGLGGATERLEKAARKPRRARGSGGRFAKGAEA